jgi:flagellar protein FlaH
MMAAIGTKERKSISSHNVELDSKMGGGLPLGTLALIEGSSSAGKSVLSQQIMWGGVQDGYRVICLTSENTVKSLVSQMASIDLDVLDYVLLGKMRIYPMALSSVGRRAPQALLEVVGSLKDYDILVIDSFTAALSNADSTDSAPILSFFERCKEITADGKTIMLTLHNDVVDPDLVSTLRSLCDAHLVLRSEKDGQRLVKLLEVAKVRGAASVTGAIVGFDVEPGWGMRIIPISKARG